MKNLKFLLAISALVSSFACNRSQVVSSSSTEYKGTASLSKGLGVVSTENIFTCSQGRKAPIGKATATDGSTWTMPSEVNFLNTAFPFASDLYNPCTGVQYRTSTEAIAALKGTDIVEIDTNGDVITAYVFADNYFEMYINGVPVGKDNVPFTQFNSNIVRFRVTKPFTIAMKLVDWEENSGIGTESNGGFSNHPGDGGMVAVFKDATNKTVAVTNANWKAQTFYTAPIKDLTCVSESGSMRLSKNCDATATNDASNFYALHWKVPTDWFQINFDDSSWPNATTFTNTTIGVDNKPAYTNFVNIFDDSSTDAQFIWSSNVILDNEVLVRYTVN